MAWNPERNALLAKLWSDGSPTPSIAATLGTTKNAILGKAYRLGLPRRAPSSRPGSAPRPVCSVSPAPPEKPLHPVLGLRQGLCRWPIGDVIAPDFRFCLEATADRAVYCAHHARIATQPARSR